MADAPNSEVLTGKLCPHRVVESPRTLWKPRGASGSQYSFKGNTDSIWGTAQGRAPLACACPGVLGGPVSSPAPAVSSAFPVPLCPETPTFALSRLSAHLPQLMK